MAIGGLSFLLHIIAIATVPWLTAKNTVPLHGTDGNTTANNDTIAGNDTMKETASTTSYMYGPAQKSASSSGLWYICHHYPNGASGTRGM